MLRLLASSKLAAVLISALLALCLVSFLVPQRSHAALSLYDQWSSANPALARAAGALGVDDVFASPGFVVLIALLAINLTACTVGRVRRRSRARIRVPSEAPDRSEHAMIPAEPAEVAATLESGFRFWGKRRVEDHGSHYVLVDRGALGFAGSLIMHAGLLLLLIAGLVSALTRFDGRLVMTVSETVTDVAESYYGDTKEPVLGSPYDGSVVTLDSLEFDYEEGYITQAHGWLTFRDGAASKIDEAIVNRPARWRGKSYLMLRGGHAVRLSVVGADGVQLYEDTSVRLGRAVDGGYADEIVLPDGRTIELYSTADVTSPDSAVLEPLRLNDPAVSVRLAEGGEAALIRPGTASAVGDLVVSVGDVSLWNEFAVRGDRGIPLAYASFGVILMGAALRFAFDRRRLGCLIVPASGGSEVWWWSAEGSALDRARKSLQALAVEGAE